MPYLMKSHEGDVLGKKKYINAAGETQCVEFVRKAAGAPPTSHWKPGTKITSAGPGSIARGTAIATFVGGKYPTDQLGKHAAIYLSHDNHGIQVLDQWNGEPYEVAPRTIRFNEPPGTKRSNEGNWFYVIE